MTSRSSENNLLTSFDNGFSSLGDSLHYLSPRDSSTRMDARAKSAHKKEKVQEECVCVCGGGLRGGMNVREAETENGRRGCGDNHWESGRVRERVGKMRENWEQWQSDVVTKRKKQRGCKSGSETKTKKTYKSGREEPGRVRGGEWAGEWDPGGKLITQHAMQFSGFVPPPQPTLSFSLSLSLSGAPPRCLGGSFYYSAHTHCLFLCYLSGHTIFMTPTPFPTSAV